MSYPLQGWKGVELIRGWGSMSKWIVLTASLSASALAVLLLLSGGPARAQNALLIEGFAALKAGKNKIAAKTFTDALGSSKLSQAQTAKAYFGRAQAYEALQKPAQAIADLTSAIWLGELSPADLASAKAKRTKAYAGLGVGQPAGTSQEKKIVVASTRAEPSSPNSETKQTRTSSTSSPRTPLNKKENSRLSTDGVGTTRVTKQPPSAPKASASGTIGSGGLASLWQGSGIGNLFSGGSSSAAPPKASNVTSAPSSGPQSAAITASNSPRRISPSRPNISPSTVAPANDQASDWQYSVKGKATQTPVVAKGAITAPQRSTGSTANSGGGLTSLWQNSGLSSLFSSGNPPVTSSVPSPPSPDQASRPQRLASRTPASIAPTPAAVPPQISASQTTAGANANNVQRDWDSNVTRGRASAPQPSPPSGTNEAGGLTSLWNSTGLGNLFSAGKPAEASLDNTHLASQKPGPRQTSASVTTPSAQLAPRRRVTSGTPTVEQHSVSKPTALQPTKGWRAGHGEFNLQVVTVEDLDGARAIVGDLTTRHSKLLAMHLAQIDELAARSGGKLYRVRLGPFQSVSEALSLCGALRRTGQGCFLLWDRHVASSRESRSTRALSERILRQRQ